MVMWSMNVMPSPYRLRAHAFIVLCVGRCIAPNQITPPDENNQETQVDEHQVDRHFKKLYKRSGEDEETHTRTTHLSPNFADIAPNLHRADSLLIQRGRWMDGYW